MNSQISLLVLPLDILFLILLPICGNCFRSLCRVKAVCSVFRDIICDPLFLKQIDLFGMWIPALYRPGLTDFRLTCLHHNNLSAVFIKGASMYFRMGVLDEGFDMIRRAACGGYDRAIYVYFIIRKVMFPGEPVEPKFMSLGRSYFRRVRANVKYTGIRGWNYKLPFSFLQRHDMLPYKEVDLCQCSPYDAWSEDIDTIIAAPHLCDHCFWTVAALNLEEFTVHIGPWPQ